MNYSKEIPWLEQKFFILVVIMGKMLFLVQIKVLESKLVLNDSTSFLEVTLENVKKYDEAIRKIISKYL